MNVTSISYAISISYSVDIIISLIMVDCMHRTRNIPVLKIA